MAVVLGLAAQANANPKYAGFVMDAKTGKVLYESSADEKRYPASLTKMMTLYLTFDALSSGRIAKNTSIPVSAHAASEPPSKLGLKPGQTITVDQAIKALVTKSANDAATALGEFLGGSEANFAKLMTAKARQLGMKSTVFRNAHGLPDPRQYTTARDMARLGVALREHHGRYYDYFSTRSFTYKGRRYGNHNRLLGRVEGVDGIKTGYIRASGFNLVTSVKTGGRSIVAVVMGGRTGRSRDEHMAELISRYLPKASKGTDRDLIARGSGAGVAVAAMMIPGREVPVPTSRPELDTITAYAAEEPTDMGDAPIVEAIRPSETIEVDPVSTASTARTGWVIQVASMPSEEEAKTFLARTSESAPTLLAEASAFTEMFDHKGRTYYRARFGGFSSKSEAWGACSALKKKSIPCYAVQQ